MEIQEQTNYLTDLVLIEAIDPAESEYPEALQLEARRTGLQKAMRMATFLESGIDTGSKVKSDELLINFSLHHPHFQLQTLSHAVFACVLGRTQNIKLEASEFDKDSLDDGLVVTPFAILGRQVVKTAKYSDKKLRVELPDNAAYVSYRATIRPQKTEKR